MIESQWDEGEAKLSVEGDAMEDGPFLDGLRGLRRKVFLGYRNNAGIATVQQVQHSTNNGKDRWQIAFRLQNTDLSNSMEMNTPGLTADEAAVYRARLILLNDRAVRQEGRHMNDAIKQMMIRGNGNTIEIDKGSFPETVSRTRPQAECLSGSSLDSGRSAAQIERNRGAGQSTGIDTRQEYA